MQSAYKDNSAPQIQSEGLQDASYDIWDKKYRLKSPEGLAVDMTVSDTFKRVAKALAEIEKTDDKKDYWYEEFVWALHHGAIPAGRILSNAGADAYKPATSTINCTVSGTISDSMDDILSKLHEAGLTLKSGAGIGYEFSTLRPKGAYVSGAGAYTSGPVSFMEIFDKMCFTISSAGGRRGAQMATFDIRHPDVMDFIEAKRKHSQLRQFNLSLLISQKFMAAVEQDEHWKLVFPIAQKELKKDIRAIQDEEEITWEYWPMLTSNYINNTEGKVACKVYKTVRARELWNAIMRSNYEYGEPGFILIDEYNNMNNNWFCEKIRATNPCGEQGLPPYGACLLGSINLTHFVSHPFTAMASFNWDDFCKVVRIFTRMLDNVVELNGLPLPNQRNEIINKRRHGMGFLGLGSALSMLCLKYGSKKSIDFTEQVSKELALTGWRTGLELAKEKGSAPVMEHIFTVDEEMLSKRPDMKKDHWKVGDKVSGKVLHARYSRYMQKLAAVDPALVEEIADIGARFTHHSSIAPTGTIALSLANNASNGIEPSFAHQYARNIIREGKKSKEKVNVYSYELLAYRKFVNGQAETDMLNNLPEYFVVSDDITPKEHVAIQAAAQKWIDSSISKTINVPSDFSFDEFKNIYMQAYKHNLKGCTVFRYNPEIFQGVLVKEEDLKNTVYRFTLEDDTVVEVHGNDEIEYDGEVHTAANLYDALKEGYYGKF